MNGDIFEDLSETTGAYATSDGVKRLIMERAL